MRPQTTIEESDTRAVGESDVGARRWGVLWREVRRPHRLIRGLVSQVAGDGISTLAAALSYYFFFSLFPFLLFLLALVTLLPGVEGLEDWLLGRAAEFVPGSAYASLEGVIRGLLGQPRSGLLSVGAALALWSASTAITGLTAALNVAYGVRERRPWWRVRITAIGLTIAMSFFMIVAFVLAVSSAPLAALVAGTLGPLGGIGLMLGNWLIVLAAITFVIATIYHVCPDVDFPWRWFSPGSVIFTLGFAGTTILFSFYVAHFASYDKTYGSLGAVIILLLWMYLVALLVVFGGEVNAYLDRQSSAELRPVQPAAPEPDPASDDLPRWATERSGFED